MKIVIDIPENVYKYLKQEWVKVPEDDSVINQIMHGILHGIVLPKGHGDLIDKDELIPKIHGVKSIVAVLDAPTIIGADKEATNEDSN